MLKLCIKKNYSSQGQQTVMQNIADDKFMAILAHEHAKFPANGVSRTSAERANCHCRRRCHHNGLSVAVLSSTMPIHVLCALTLPLPLFLVQTHRQICLTRGFLDANREGQTEAACPAYGLITQACSPADQQQVQSIKVSFF